MTGSFVSPATRQRVRDMAIPIARGLGRLGLTPNALTVIGFVGTCVAAVVAANQAWLAAGILVLTFGIFDLFDGTLARATGTASKFGAFLDSTLDRAGEAIFYIGIAAGSIAGFFSFGAILAASAMAAAVMVSYTRAKSESLGFAPGSALVNVGFAPREVRIAILALGLIAMGFARPLDVGADCYEAAPGVFNCLFSQGALTSAATILTLTLGIITILATITTIQRIVHARAQSREG